MLTSKEILYAYIDKRKKERKKERKQERKKEKKKENIRISLFIL